MDLAEFLLARIGEDQSLAEAVPEAPVMHISDPAVTDFLEVWHADRVLAECEAKRRILQEHPSEIVRLGQSTEPTTICRTCSVVYGSRPREHPCPTLRLMALPYADHPDYRREWRP